MNRVYRLINKVAPTDLTVLITGETGSGKELAARTIHDCSPRASGPFVPVHCGSLPDTLLESELFGYVKGAFTGATANKQGFFQAARGGTLFLDEIEAASPRTQVALLRVLDSKTFSPVGSTASVEADVRVLAATNLDLVTAVSSGQFRSDLYFRLNQTEIPLPPLRERIEDIAMLAEHFLATSPNTGKGARKFSRPAIDALCAYSWPGNVRELANAVLRSAVLARGNTIGCTDLPRAIQLATPLQSFRTLAEVEREQVECAMKRANHRKAAAARLLGVSRTTLYSLLQKHMLAS
jgi:DNA-binding NtrC family response regulator